MSPESHAGARSRLRRGGRFLARVIITAAAIWLATLLLPAFWLDESATQQLLAVLIPAVAFRSITDLLWVQANRVLAVRQRRWFDERFGDFNDFSDFDDHHDHFWRDMLPLVPLPVTSLIMVVVVGPAVLWCSIWLCAGIGLPVRLSGFWPTVAAGLVVQAVYDVAGWLLTKRGQASAAVRSLARYGLSLGGLSLAVAVLGGVRLESGSGWQPLLTMATLAALFNLQVGYVKLTLSPETPWRAIAFNGAKSIGGVALIGLRLWLVCWLSTWMELSLRISGVGTFLLTVLLIMTVMWPARVADRYAEAKRRPLSLINQW